LSTGPNSLIGSVLQAGFHWAQIRWDAMRWPLCPIGWSDPWSTAISGSAASEDHRFLQHFACCLWANAAHVAIASRSSLSLFPPKTLSRTLTKIGSTEKKNLI